MRWTGWLADSAYDLRLAARILAKDRAFSLVVIITLALGVGANAAMFSVIEAVLLQPLPFRDPERLVWISENNVTATGQLPMLVGRNLRDWKDRATSFDVLSALLTGDATMSGEERQVRVACVSGSLTDIFGIAPVLGRDFLSGEFDRAPQAPGLRPSSENRSDTGTAVVSDRLFRRRFGGDPAILGTSVVIGVVTYTIVGVLPSTFRLPIGPSLQFGVGPQTDVGVVLNTTPSATSQVPGGALGRLKAGVSIQTATVELETIRSAAGQKSGEATASSDLALQVIPLHELLVRNTRRSLLVVWASVGFVLLVACVNIMNLLLARGAARARTTAIRVALGASRWRLARQTLAEGMVITFAAGVAGVALAFVLVRVAAQSTAVDIPRMADATINWTVLVFSTGICAMTGIVFSVIPAISSGVTLTGTLRENVRATLAARRTRQWHAALVVCEIALTLIPLTGAGLMLRSLWTVRAEGAQLAPERVLAAGIHYSRPQSFATAEERIRENDHLLARIEMLPTVRAAALWRVTFGYPVRVVGLPEPQDKTVAMWFNVSPQYLEASGVRLLAGRWFAAQDRAASPAVVVSERLAGRFAPDPANLSSLVGRAIVGPFPASGSTVEEGAMTILGVVSDFRSGRFGILRPDDANASPQVFFLDALRPLPGGELLIRTSSDPLALIAPVQRIVRSRSDRTVVGARTLSDQLAIAVAPRTFTTGLIVAFAGMASMLAMVGIAGVLSFAVTHRTPEIGVRVALGARPFDVLRLILSEAATLVGAGAVVGLAGCVVLSTMMRGLLYGVAPTDPWAHVTVSGLMVAVALVAAYLPARAALRVDPGTALRHE